MKQHMDMIVMLIVAFLLFTKPNVLVKFANSIPGRFVLIGAMLFALLHSTLSGVFVAILFVLLSEEMVEGFDQQQIEEASKNMDAQYKAHLEVIENNCTGEPGKAHTTFVDSDGNVLSLDEIKSKYPFHFTYDGETCNPCSDSLQEGGICPFTISPVLEQMTNMERMQPVSSKRIDVPCRGGNCPKDEE